jgi:hypothetical protein
MMRCLLAFVLCGVLLAQVRMNVEQLRAFIQSSRKLGHSDKQIADYVKNIKMTESLDEATIEDLGGGSQRTTEALRRLMETSKSLPAPTPPAPKPVVAPIPPPDSVEQARVLQVAREYARDYSKKLPNFICTQVTRRYEDPSGLEFWQPQDTVVEKLSFFEQKEDYKLIFVNNRAFTGGRERIGGTVTRGEFGTRLKEVFDPKSDASFEWERWATLRGKRMHVFRYAVRKENSEYSVRYETATVVPAYEGLVYIDRETLAVMRITQEVKVMPAGFPIAHILAILDYDFTKVADSEFVLPLKASTVARMAKHLFKNDVEFRNYNRFGAEATITFAPDPLPDEALKEQPATKD